MIEHFPDDWILPGEFRFCNAGWHLLPSAAPQTCPVCNSQSGEVALYESGLRRARTLLAQARKDAGLPRLFWMNAAQQGELHEWRGNEGRTATLQSLGHPLEPAARSAEVSGDTGTVRKGRYPH